MGALNTQVEIIEDWKRDVTDHLQELGEQQGEDCQQLQEAEEQNNQLQALVVSLTWEMGVMGDVI